MVPAYVLGASYQIVIAEPIFGESRPMSVLDRGRLTARPA